MSETSPAHPATVGWRDAIEDLPGDMLTVGQIAERLKYSPHSIRKLCEDGILPAIRMKAGGAWRIAKKDLLRYLEQQAVGNATTATPETY